MSDDLKSFFLHVAVIGVIVVFVVSITNVANAPRDAYWANGACLRSHSETKLSMVSCGPSFGLDGQMHMDCQAGRARVVTETVCDERAPPVCMPGTDGVADCTPQ